MWCPGILDNAPSTDVSHRGKSSPGRKCKLVALITIVIGIMATDAAVEMVSLIDGLGQVKYRTPRDQVYRAMRVRGYTAEEIAAAERELSASGTVEQREEFLEWTRPRL